MPRRQTDPKNILIVKTHAIGDVLMTTPALRALHHQFPQARFGYFTGRWSHQAIKDSPYLRDLITVDDHDLFGRRLVKLAKLLWQLRSEKYDRAYIFQPAPEIHRLIQMAGIPERIGFHHLGSQHTLTHGIPWEPDDRRYGPDRYLDLVRETGGEPRGLHLEITIPPDTADEIQRIIHNPPKPWIALCPGGGMNPRQAVPEKQWHADRWAELAERITPDMGTPILVGGSADFYIARDITINNNRVISEGVGQLTLAGSAEVIRQSALCITHDSATMHLAVAANVPTIAIFGPTDPDTLLPNDLRFRPVFHHMQCRPCYSHGIFPGCTDPQCIDGLDIDTVWNAVLEHWNTYSIL